ncbi:transmembrane protein, putative [Bodo saltans]|uniref:Transmembrane protein, putative n=1 Tax=Bodo saltans TaxID=75058 RepID=A0A0S4JGV3_BODSA|nr:transmembrane protein, putative [Bodo saltans]|eukprot:CUG88222.1 transmembrane protein, putative [Bodo saltans]
MCMFISGVVSDNSTSDDASSSSAAISALSFAVSVISCTKALHVLFIAWWLRQAQWRTPQGKHFESVGEVGEDILGSTSRARSKAGLRSLIEMICLAKSKCHGLSDKKRPHDRSGIRLVDEWY